MKVFTLLAFLFLLKTGISQIDISKDTMLQNVVDELPEGWSAKITDHTLRFEFNRDVYIAPGNWINASIDHWKLKSDSTWIKENGRACEAFIEYHIQSTHTSMKMPNKRYQSNKHLLSFTRQSSCLEQYEAQYNAIWPEDIESFMYQLPRLFEKHLMLVETE